jgi:hypothetical protein
MIKYKNMKYLLFSGFVPKGFQFYDIGTGKRCPDNMWPGQKVKLVPEPKNPKDRQAIQIYWRKLKLGYLPAHCEPILRLIQADAKLTAEIEYVDEGSVPRIKIWLHS